VYRSSVLRKPAEMRPICSRVARSISTARNNRFPTLPTPSSTASPCRAPPATPGT
jgi:hypothetical protein